MDIQFIFLVKQQEFSTIHLTVDQSYMAMVLILTSLKILKTILLVLDSCSRHTLITILMRQMKQSPILTYF